MLPGVHYIAVDVQSSTKDMCPLSECSLGGLVSTLIYHCTSDYSHACMQSHCFPFLSFLCIGYMSSSESISKSLVPALHESESLYAAS